MFKTQEKPIRFSFPWNSNLTSDVETFNSDTSSPSSNNWFNFNYLNTFRKNKEYESEGRSTKIESFLSCFPSLGYYQRLVGFAISFSIGILFLFLSAMNIPVLILRSRKFSLLFTIGSIAIITSIGFLTGPTSFFDKLFSRNHLVFSTVYTCSLLGTLYSALLLQSTILTIPCATFQVLALVWLVFSFIPGGQKGLKLITSVLSSTARRSVSQTLPV